jgi:hypothetical protein
MKNYPDESDKIKRARRKLKKRWEEVEKKTTRESLKKKIEEIDDKITRNSQDRVVLKSKLVLFDKNQNSAEMSDNIAILYNTLKKELSSKK